MSTVATKNEMRVMDHTGDTTIKWDPENEQEVMDAESMFNCLTGDKGYRAFSVERGGKSKKITSFDPKAGEIVMLRPLAGG